MRAHIPSFGRNPRGSLDLLAYPVPKACMHVLGTGVPRCLGVPHSASSPKAALALGCSLTPGLLISFGRGTRMALGCLNARAMDTAFPTVVWCLCLGLGFAVTPPILAGVQGVCAWVLVLVSPHHSWLQFVACAVGLAFWLASRQSWLGFLGCVSLRARSTCSPPFLAGVFGVGVCAWVRVSAAPCHSWLAFWVVCYGVCTPSGPRQSWLGCAVWVSVLGRVFGLRPTIRGGIAGLCVLVCAIRLYPAYPRWVWVWVCVLGLRLRLRLECWGGCVCVRVPPVPRNSWFGCAVWVCEKRL